MEELQKSFRANFGSPKFSEDFLQRVSIPHIQQANQAPQDLMRIWTMKILRIDEN
jgi:hypothetical protein